MQLGYARVSTVEQNLRLQVDALREAGCDPIFEDHGVSGDAEVKPQLRRALDMLGSGDVLVVWRLDRLSRSLSELIETVTSFDKAGIGFRSLRESVDTTSAGGRLVFHIMGALAEFERDVIRERTRAGVLAARNAGKRLGRPPTITDERWAHARPLLTGETPKTVAEIATLLGVTRQAVYKRLKQEAEA